MTNKTRSSLTGRARKEQARELRGRYEAGETIRGLAAAAGSSYGLTRTLLLEAGTTLRGRGGRLPLRAEAAA
ncbi:transcriptional regulator [Streptomyces gancidicus BKS 13-15]|uniref:Transcriptional regulator n=1 Tax=Streptomyces gancidicus BKS 13-15 TaxID=1284664 RepID=M3EBL1_STREZ|nr:helix-turn-helix domain-containing protein [Streptomyces gancidicus]EMF31097.1 transcriptional regulator [Streptomyces gancidicus BKS 13-15]